MKEINVLPPAIFNLLAAGEVVENPASIVKETVENSIDAGATLIEVAITEGGIGSICVTDNGAGCDESQIEKVFLPHATSKVKNAVDLEKIGTLGFRGEALSSIASVSKIEFISRTKESAAAAKLQLEAGIVSARTRVGANQGTQILIKNLFFNTPARKKFLASIRAEQNNVTATVQKLILANPEISFKYSIDGQVFYNYESGGLIDAIELIYGKETAANIVSVDAKSKDMKLIGYISKPVFTKKNRTYQTVMINGRAIEAGTVAAAANDAFSNYLTVGNFPFFVLDLRIDTGAVDVNVHPRKAQVKFSNEREIFSFVRESVVDCIDKYFFEQNKPFANGTEADLLKAAENIKFEKSTDYQHQSAQITNPAASGETKADNSSDKEVLQNIKFLSSSKPASGVRSAPNVLSLLEKMDDLKLKDKQAKKDASEQAASTKFNPYYKSKKASQVEMESATGLGFDAKVLGTIFDTYILISGTENFYIIDQHAAHERFLYDELSKQIDSGKVATQVLVEPSMLILSPQEMNQMTEAQPYLNQMGIECEVFGNNCFRITAVPIAVSDRGIDTVIANVLSEVKGMPPASLSGLLKEKIIRECCKNAIKAGQHLLDEQINYFLSQFKNSGMTPLCPHGRPIIISFTKQQIEKMFLRINK